MSWSIGWDMRWKRDIGYGVPAKCDHPKCEEEIDRGLSYVCGGEAPFGGESGCGLYFCEKHRYYHRFRNGDSGYYCKRCVTYKWYYKAKPDVLEWIAFKLTDDSWEEWRKENPEEVRKLGISLKGA